MKIKSPIQLDIAECQKRVETYMQGWLNSLSAPTRLREAMQYSVLGGGKRLRALLVYAAGVSFGADLNSLDPAAAAVELVHAYSLVHDDLPAMDDDDLRRGKPTCHKAFDEATAILVGDALQPLAFTILSTHDQTWSNEIRLECIKTLAEAIGAIGMVGGQMLDIEAENRKITLNELETLHHLKTGALIRASLRLGALAAGCLDFTLLKALEKLGELIGLAFQVQDDILDVESTTEILGKRAGADEALNKSTYPSLLGLIQAKNLLKKLYAQAEQTLKMLTIDTFALTQVVVLLRERQS
jgi:geranylgeranyl pyrophosphate synthase